jgi:hypothetical protein
MNADADKLSDLSFHMIGSEFPAHQLRATGSAKPRASG